MTTTRKYLVIREEVLATAGVLTFDDEAARAEAQRMSLATGGSTFLVLVTQWEAKIDPDDVPVRYVAATEAPIAPAPAASEPESRQLTIKPHGIYERRDRKIVGPALINASEIEVDCSLYHRNGERTCRVFSSEDLVREIVVGEGWRPWNGGECPVEGDARVEYVARSCVGDTDTDLAFRLEWNHDGSGGDILAYRVAAPAVLPATVAAEEV